MTILVLLQILILVAITIYFAQWRTDQQRRKEQTWETLLARLCPDWSARDLSDHFLWKEDLNATPEIVWQRLEGPKGLWVMYENSRVMLEMADFAARNNPSIDPLLLESLREDALQLRISVLGGLAQYGFSHTSDAVRVNAYRAASHYTVMAARLTHLLQDHAARILPDFVAAM